MTPSTLRGEKFPAAAPCTSINPISRRSIAHRSARRIEIGASSATPAEPIAPAIAGAAATAKTTHGINGRRPRASLIDPSTIRATVPLRSAIAKRYVTPVRSTNRSTGNPRYISAGASRATLVPTRNVMTSASTPRLIGRSVPITKTITSPMMPARWMGTPG